MLERRRGSGSMLGRGGGSKQENHALPGSPKSNAGFDSFLWYGSQNATATQRVGLLVFGLSFVFVGVSLLVLARENRSIIHAVVSTLFCLLGAKLSGNAFRRRRRGNGTSQPAKNDPVKPGRRRDYFRH